ncbi:MAG: 23S rRNA (uracil(1939)-C(5))-methyltransferase RlmD [Desulfobulbaceae bacterium]|nr:23S rRNA (uracil(1939)-C(5))-methyltransferase RlmD [Desulfobulbaceae bacterium]
MSTETITIEKIVNGGYGLSHLASGQVILVRNVLPDEVVIVTPQEAKKNYLFGKVQEIRKGHPGRATPPCRYFGKCGGCDLQHSDYNTQLEIKKAILEDLLLRQESSPLKEVASKLPSPLPSPHFFHYRQRIRLQVDKDGQPGFRRYRSHDIVAIDSCLLAEEHLNSSLRSLQNSEEAEQLIALSTEVELQSNPDSGNCVVIFNFRRKIRPADIKAAQKLCETVISIERIFISGKDFPLQGPFCSQQPESSTADNLMSCSLSLENGVEDFQLSWEAGGFCQVNLKQNKTLIETVLQLSQPQKEESLLDLYCGMGNFSIPLAFLVKEVFGIEGQGSAIRSARRNATQAGLTNTNFKKSPVHTACDQLIKEGKIFDTVVIDPPRQGAPELASQLTQLTNKKLVYISCDPATLCRDLTALTSHGFSINKIVPIDMFPQTHHIETVVILEKQV